MYLTALTGVGLFGPDEPRYAAIGRAMARSGDWVTPRLWGHPWFEKPPLLYWMTAAGFRLGLGPDLAPRLPVALLSAGFIVFLFFTVRREFGETAAWHSCAILSTSLGWFAYSHVGVTDLPLAALFSAAMLLLLSPGSSKRASLAGILLGLAVLDKALVPLVLFLPACFLLRKRARDLALVLCVAGIVALPWFIACYMRNGLPFLDDLIWKQHFARFTSGSLQHVQPFWFYIPVILGALFPWSPIIILYFKKRLYDEDNKRFLILWLVFGLIFFSASRNKLPGYVLPLLPAAAILGGIALSHARNAVVLALAVALTGFTAVLRNGLAPAVLMGITHTHFHLSFVPALTGCLAVPCFWIARSGRPSLIVGIVTGLMAFQFGLF